MHHLFFLIILASTTLTYGEYIYVGSSRNKDFYTTDIKGNIEEFYDACIKENEIPGLEPSEVENEEENNVVASYLRSLPTTELFWTSASDLFHEGEFTWIRDQSPITYYKFIDSNYLTRNCINLNKDGYWRFVPCAGAPVLPLCQVRRNDYIRIGKPIEMRKFNSSSHKNKNELLKLSVLNGDNSIKKNYYTEPTSLGYRFFMGMEYCHQYNLKAAIADTIPDQLLLIQWSKDIIDGQPNQYPYFWLGAMEFYTKRGKTNMQWITSLANVEETALLQLIPANEINNCLMVLFPNIQQIQCVYTHRRPLCEEF